MSLQRQRPVSQINISFPRKADSFIKMAPTTFSHLKRTPLTNCPCWKSKTPNRCYAPVDGRPGNKENASAPGAARGAAQLSVSGRRLRTDAFRFYCLCRLNRGKKKKSLNWQRWQNNAVKAIKEENMGILLLFLGTAQGREMFQRRDFGLCASATSGPAEALPVRVSPGDIWPSLSWSPVPPPSNPKRSQAWTTTRITWT